MKVAIFSFDSDIGRQLMKLHTARGDEVYATSRNDVDYAYFELNERGRWPIIPTDIDRIYYLIGTHERGILRETVMNTNSLWTVEALGYFAKSLKPGAEIVVFTSHMGSLEHTADSRAWVYRMSKAALNMGIKCMSQFFPEQRWLLYHPGIVKTKILGDRWNSFGGEVLEAPDAAQRCINIVDDWDGEFKFISYKGVTIPW